MVVIAHHDEISASTGHGDIKQPPWCILVFVARGAFPTSIKDDYIIKLETLRAVCREQLQTALLAP